MLPKRKGTAPRPKPKFSPKNDDVVDVVEQLQQQIEEEREKKRKEKLNKEKTPLLQKTIAKKKPTTKEIPERVVEKETPKEIKEQDVKKYADSETISTDPIPQKKLEPTAFTYFDRLADRDIMLSDSD